MLECTGERQVRASIEAIAPDHVARYEHVVQQIKEPVLILDIGAGIGYGSQLMAETGSMVHAYELSEEAIEYGLKYWAHDNVIWHNQDISDLSHAIDADFCVAFEILEHIDNPEIVLQQLAKKTKHGYFSVPNELVVPYSLETHPFHARHYTPGEFIALIEDNYGEVKALFTQYDKWSGDIVGGDGGRDDGRTIIIEATAK